MKRSEVLKIIEGLFELAPKFNKELNAENLLSTLEELGMSPPPDITVGTVNGMIMCQWEWEDTDGF